MCAVFIFGHDVSNKSSICSQLSQELGYTHLQSTELLRNEVKAGTELGLELADMIKQGKIIPQSKIATLIQNAMEAGGVFLVDGFPKSVDSLSAFEEVRATPACTGGSAKHQRLPCSPVTHEPSRTGASAIVSCSARVELDCCVEAMRKLLHRCPCCVRSSSRENWRSTLCLMRQSS